MLLKPILLKGDETDRALCKLAKELGVVEHAFRTVGIMMMQIVNMGRQEEYLDKLRKPLTKEERLYSSMRNWTTARPGGWSVSPRARAGHFRYF